jgi:TonB dependent receptor
MVYRRGLAELSGVAFWLALAAQGSQADTTAAGTDPLEEVTVRAQRIPASSERVGPSTSKLLKVPGGFGDPLQAVYSLPGVLATDEGGGQPAVRGSGPDDNTFLVDFLPASYVFHDFGHSIFNENLISEFGLKAAGFGARYGRATGAVFDVSLREPRSQPLTTTIDASLLRAGGLLEGRITDSQSFYVAARASVIDQILDASGYEPDEEDDLSIEQFPQDRDFQAKYSWDIDARNQLSVSALGAWDKAAATFGRSSDGALIDPGSSGKASLDTQFVSQGVRWIYEDDLNKLQSAVGYLQQSRRDRRGNLGEYLDLDVGEWTVKSHYDRRLTSSHVVATGFEYRRSQYDYAIRLRFRSCTIFTPGCETEPGEMTQARSSQEIATTDAFIEDIWKVTPNVTLTSGVHFARNEYLRESHVEPRLAAQWDFAPGWEVHGSWGEYHQLPNIDQIVPVFGNPRLESPQATHYVLGLGHKPGGLWSFNADIYYKDLSNLVVDVGDARLYSNDASGRAYGAEVLINRDTLGKWYGWLSLSLSKTERLNGLTGLTAAFDYDAPVVANLVLSYRINSRWEAGLRWNLRSGMPYTPVIGNKPNPQYPGYYLPVYGELNSERAAAYHRLDLRFERKFQGARISGSYYVDIINAYGNRNGGAVAYEAIEGSSEFKLKEQEGLPFFPSVGVKITF